MMNGTNKVIKKDSLRTKVIDFLILVLACAVGAFATTAVLIPNGLTSGGLTGMVRILQSYININFSVAYYAIAAIILITVAVLLGWREAQKVIIATVMYPAVIFVFEKFDFILLEEKDVLLAVVFCGILMGTCSGLSFSRGFAFCGTESIAKIIKRKLLPHMPLSKVLLCLDAIIIISSAAIFGRNIALYALITQFISAKTIDFILYGFEAKIVQLDIISSMPEMVIDYVTHTIGRGISSRTIVGEYTGEERKELIVLCSPRESILIKKFLAVNDHNAFVTILHVDTVFGHGKGFTDIDKEKDI